MSPAPHCAVYVASARLYPKPSQDLLVKDRNMAQLITSSEVGTGLGAYIKIPAPLITSNRLALPLNKSFAKFAELRYNQR
jgi:hypothetical protein